VTATRHAPDEERARVLVVDDVEANRDLLARRVRRMGHEVAIATNGREALDAIGRERFDLVLLDIMMPGMSGYEVLERLKADERHRHVPVIMISAVDEVDSVVRCIELGADDYLPKPFNPVLLRARMDASLARKRLRDGEQRHAEAMARELEIGRNIQRSFLPEMLPDVPGYELAAVLEPARQVAGDFYDAFTVDGGRRVILAVGDVCDKGVAAALFMAIFRSLIRTIIDPAYAGATGDDPEALPRVAGLLNNYIVQTHGRTNMFATLFLASLDPATGRLTYVNGGQDPPLLLGDGRDPRRLDVTGPAVGLMPDMPFRAGMVELASGDRLLAYTDGVPEGRAPSGEEFGDGRLVAAATGAATADALVTGTLAACRTFVGEAPQLDDITLLALRRS
jgi:serine phosphatase RsbU (regulator of sigma subunit)